MPRPTASVSPAGLPPVSDSPLPSGVLHSAAPVSPFRYTNQPNMPGSGVVSSLTPAELFLAFRRRWILCTLLGLLAGALAAAVAWVLMPNGTHEVRALIQIRSRSSELDDRLASDFAEYRNRQLFLLQTRDLIARTINEPGVGQFDLVKQSADPVQKIAEQLSAKAATDDLILVTLTGDNLEEMKVFLDRLVKNFIADATNYDRKEADEQIKQLEQLVEALRIEIKAREKQIELLSRANSTTGGEDNARRLALLQQQFIMRDAEYHKLGRELLLLEAERDLLKGPARERKEELSPDPVQVAQAIDRDPRVVKAKGVLDKKQQELLKAIETAGGNEKVSFVVELKAEAAMLESAYQEARQSASKDALASASASEFAARKNRIALLEQTIKIKTEIRNQIREERDGYKKLIDAGVGSGSAIQSMRDALKSPTEMLEQTNLRLARLRLDDKAGSRIWMRGNVEKVPHHTPGTKFLLAGASGLITLLGVVLLATFIEWRTRRVDGVDQIVKELGMRVIGTVPAFPGRASLETATGAGEANWRFVLNESINSTRTMLLHAARLHSMQVVMVTSATQGEGKTSLASQLATSMAVAGMRALVIDCDLRNPSVQKIFELPQGPGVSEVLRQEADVSDVVQATTVPNLWIIPAGQCSAATLAALAQGHPLETIFNRLRGQFDFVIVDSCPVLPVADALLIGQHVDGVVFSVMQDVSQLPQVMAATEKLQQLHIPLIGAVVNGIRQNVHSYSYNYSQSLPE